ncbi:glycoside hydrolase family 18 protein [Infundibulicybe gibba]|nr:glycoside hydrolase family 18 protein [Infundibulicybe gibba]
MVAFSLSCIATIAFATVFAGRAGALPLTGTSYTGLDSQARDILSRATPATPHFITYSGPLDGATGPPPASDIKGFNVFILAFLLRKGAWDQADEWQSLSDTQRSTIKSQYAAAGIKLIVSAFGSTDLPTDSDPVSLANQMAGWVKQYNLDGIDVDYEDLDAFNSGSGQAENWLISFTKQLRVQLPQGKYILSHAPVAPWFQPNRWGGGGYLKIHQSVGNIIDWYNVQFYNQGDSEYTTCTGLLTASSNAWPQTSVFEIAASGVPLSKIVIGKPATTNDASNGFVSTSTLATCLQQAKNKGWNGGAMVWQFPGPTVDWIKTVRSLSWPV